MNSDDAASVLRSSRRSVERVSQISGLYLIDGALVLSEDEMIAFADLELMTADEKQAFDTTWAD